MNPTPSSPDPLERRIHQALRSLPPRRAPASLELRVLAEIERRAALPWWRRSFVHWPVAARSVFVVVSLVLVRYAFALAGWVMDGFNGASLRQALAAPLAWYDTGATVVNAIGGFVEVMQRNLPAPWLYAGLACLAAAYATLLGLGAAAYKALNPRH